MFYFALVLTNVGPFFVQERVPKMYERECCAEALDALLYAAGNGEGYRPGIRAVCEASDMTYSCLRRSMNSGSPCTGCILKGDDVRFEQTRKNTAT